MVNKESVFINKLHKSYDIDNYVIDKDFVFEEDKIFFEDNNTIIYDIGDGLGFKIEKSLFNKMRESYNIEEMVYSLVLRQSSVNLTDFPVGVVSCKRRCIGQVIKLYKNYVPLYDFVNDDNIELLKSKNVNPVLGKAK